MLLNTKHRFWWGSLQESHEAQHESTDLYWCSLKRSGKFITESPEAFNVLYLNGAACGAQKGTQREAPGVKKKGCGGAAEAKQGEPGAYSN